MKIKFLLALLFVVGLGFTSMAQTISVGPRVGATFSTINSDEFEEGDIDTKSTTGFQVGAVLNVGINDLFSIERMGEAFENAYKEATAKKRIFSQDLKRELYA